MCAIISSFSIDKFKELYELNAYRGTRTSSFTVIDEDSDIVTLNRFDDPSRMFAVIESVYFQGESGCYFLGHSQAPTTSASGIHPAEQEDTLLWHNGIVKEYELKRLNTQENTNFIWDTELILHLLNKYGYSALSDIDGSFACVLNKNGKFFTFRNAIVPLFVDDALNMSSTKFEDSRLIPPHKIFQIDIPTKTLIDTGISFSTKNNPYSI